VDAAEALHPGGVDEVLLRCLAGNAARTSLRDAKVSVDGIAREIDSRILGRRLDHAAIISVNGGLKRGIDLFNSGRYWDAHEAWEHEWMLDRKGSDAAFYKGLIQVAAGCLHYSRHNRRGAINKWRSGADYLRPYLPAHHSVQLAPLVAAADQFLAAMQPREWPELTMPRILQE
jgi:predicted metal-dependent hydrolase